MKALNLTNTMSFPYRFVCVNVKRSPEARCTVWRLGVSSAPEKPRWVLVDLQTDKIDNQENNAAIFYHCNLTNMQVWLNHSRYPSVDMATYFTKEKYSGVCKSF